MEAIELRAQVRRESGKGPARRMRMNGFVPAVFYGAGSETKLLCLSMTELRKYLKERRENVFIKLLIEDGAKSEEKLTMIKELQTSPVRKGLMHADFYEIRMDHKLSIDVPIHFVGTPAGVELGGELHQIKREIRISGLPSAIPEFLEVDISGLGIGDSVQVGDIKLSEGIEIEDAADVAVASVSAPKAVVEEAAPAEGERVAEPEVIGQKPEKAEA